MLVVDSILGNVETDADLAAARDRHRATGTLERVVLEERDRRRSRFRTTTDAGTELGVVLDAIPDPGDVLVANDERMMVVQLEPVETLVVTFDADLALSTAVALGHAIGNKHWDLATRDGRVYIATDGHGDRRRSELTSLLPPSAAVTLDRVSPALFDGTDTVHAHGPESHTHETFSGDASDPLSLRGDGE